jgi:hypothetical protein
MRDTRYDVKTLAVLILVAAVSGACSAAPDRPSASPTALEEGDRAPGFTLESPEAEISLDDYRGEKAVLLYFSMGPG